LADLTVDAERCIVAWGGLGGWGNARFATPTNRAPRYAQSGIEGEERQLKLELKLLADVGIIGFPNAGKSTFIAKVSAAKPKIADYPFTTLVPNLGVVRYGDFKSFVIADIPGLIAGAHAGMGMGTKFLRHIERCALLFHIIDISGETHSSAWQDFEAINRELALFSPALIKKSQIVAINKIDLFLTRERIKGEIASFEEKGIKLLPFSALTGEGIGDIINEIAEKLHQTRIC
jgi:GTP-binding protein